MLSQIPGVDRVDAYCITVKNVGMKAVTISNVYLHFGDKKNGDIFVGMLNQGSLLQPFTPTCPKRLDQGEFFEFHLLKDKLDAALAHYEESTPLETPLSIMNLMDSFREKLDNHENVTHGAFESEIYKIVPSRYGDYHFCEYLAQAFMEEHRWEEVFPALYGDMPKYSYLKKD